jgi:hypothetical protein
MNINNNFSSFPPSLNNDENAFLLHQTDAALLRPHVFDILDLAVKMRCSTPVEESEDTNEATSRVRSVIVGNAERRSGHLLEDEQSLHDVLEIADFLFGPLLESALALLESPCCSMTENDFNRLPNASSAKTRSPTAVGAVRRICATPSGRIAYLVRGSGLPGRKKSSKQGQRSQEYYYLCLLTGPYSSYYCSCRSFHDKLGQNSMDNAKMGSSSTIQNPLRQGALCKHLLAAKMALILEYSYEEVEVSEETFVQLWLQSSLQDL